MCEWPLCDTEQQPAADENGYYRVLVYTPNGNGWLYASKANATVFTDSGPGSRKGHKLTFGNNYGRAVLTWSNEQGRITLSCS